MNHTPCPTCGLSQPDTSCPDCQEVNVEGRIMKKYLVEYYDPVIGWIDLQVTNTEEEAHKVMSDYLHAHPGVMEVRYREVMR